MKSAGMATWNYQKHRLQKEIQKLLLAKFQARFLEKGFLDQTFWTIFSENYCCIDFVSQCNGNQVSKFLSSGMLLAYNRVAHDQDMWHSNGRQLPQIENSKSVPSFDDTSGRFDFALWSLGALYPNPAAAVVSLCSGTSNLIEPKDFPSRRCWTVILCLAHPIELKDSPSRRCCTVILCLANDQSLINNSRAKHFQQYFRGPWFF